MQIYGRHVLLGVHLCLLWFEKL